MYDPSGPGISASVNGLRKLIIYCYPMFPPTLHTTITRGIRKYTKLITYNCESGGEIEI